MHTATDTQIFITIARDELIKSKAIVMMIDDSSFGPEINIDQILQ